MHCPSSNYVSYNKSLNHLSVRGRIWIPNKSSRMAHLLYLFGMVKVCLLRRMRFILNLQMLRRFSLRMTFIINLPFLNMQLIHMFRIPPPMDSGRNFLFMLRVPYFLAKGGGIPRLDRQIMKVLRSKEVSVENSS